MSKEFRPWKIDEAQLLPPSVQDYVPGDHLSRLIVALVREELDLSAISGSYRSVLGQPPFVRCGSRKTAPNRVKTSHFEAPF